MNKRARRKAILRVLRTWTDDEAARALEWSGNGYPIFVGCEEVRWDALKDGAL